MQSMLPYPRQWVLSNVRNVTFLMTLHMHCRPHVCTADGHCNRKITGVVPKGHLWASGLQAVDACQCQNGGYFVFRKEVLDELQEGEDLVTDTLQRMSSSGKVYAHMHRGFWMPADTVKERAELEKMYQSGNRPWALWKNGEIL